jgi:hypothetical protein
MNCHLTPGSLSEPPAGNAVSRYGLPSLFPNNGNTCGLNFNINIYTNIHKQMVTGFCVLAVGSVVILFLVRRDWREEYCQNQNLQNLRIYRIREEKYKYAL